MSEDAAAAAAAAVAAAAEPDSHSLSTLYSIISSITSVDQGNELMPAPAPEMPPLLDAADLNDPQRTAELLSFWAEGITTTEIASRMQTHKKAIEQRIAKIRRGQATDEEKQQLHEATETRNKLRGVDEHKWTTEMVEFLLDCKSKGMGNKEIGLLMNKTAKAVERKAYKLLRPQGPRTPGGRLIKPNPDEAEDSAHNERLDQLKMEIAAIQEQQSELLREQARILTLLSPVAAAAAGASAANDPVAQLSELQQSLQGEPSEEEKARMREDLAHIDNQVEELNKQMLSLNGDLEALQEQIKIKQEALVSPMPSSSRKRKRSDGPSSSRKRTKKEEEDTGAMLGGGELALYDGTSVPDVASILAAVPMSAPVLPDASGGLHAPVLGPVLGDVPVTPTAMARRGGRGRGGRKMSRDDEDDFRPDATEYSLPSVPSRSSSRRAASAKRSYANFDGDEDDDDDDHMDDDSEEAKPKRTSTGGGRGRGRRPKAAAAAPAAEETPDASGGDAHDPATMMNILSAAVAAEHTDAPAPSGAESQDQSKLIPVTSVGTSPIKKEPETVPETTPGPFKLL